MLSIVYPTGLKNFSFTEISSDDYQKKRDP